MVSWPLSSSNSHCHAHIGVGKLQWGNKAASFAFFQCWVHPSQPSLSSLLTGQAFQFLSPIGWCVFLSGEAPIMFQGTCKLLVVLQADACLIWGTKTSIRAKCCTSQLL